MSCPREMRPTPIAPTLMRLLGAYCPKTLRRHNRRKTQRCRGSQSGFQKLRRETLPLHLIRIIHSMLVLQRHEFRILLRLDHQFRGQQAFVLVLRHMGAIHNVGHKLGPNGSGMLLQSMYRAWLLSTMKRLLPCFFTATSVYFRTSI